MIKKYKLLFVSPRFLFPVNTGGQIRTTQILRGMKGGKFEITLASPVPPNVKNIYEEELSLIADKYIFWPENKRGELFNILRFKHLFSHIPISVVTDKSKQGSYLINQELKIRPDVVVFDFPHSAVLAPKYIPVPSVIFTHNVESEIFQRHAKVERKYIKKYIWKNQYKKMEKYERKVLSKFDSIVAVSERDKKILSLLYNVENISVINTGVDLDYFNYQKPGDSTKVVFTGSMDWYANIDGIEYLMNEVWPLIVKEYPRLHMDVVGRNQPAKLKEKAKEKGFSFNFTGFVDDIRPYVHEANIYVVPLRVGGGTRLKIFEAMAMGCPIVSTAIGVEGLPVEEGRHFLRADTPEEISNAILQLATDKNLRLKLSQEARSYVEDNFSHFSVARQFEDICMDVLERINTKDDIIKDY